IGRALEARVGGDDDLAAAARAQVGRDAVEPERQCGREARGGVLGGVERRAAGAEDPRRARRTVHGAYSNATNAGPRGRTSPMRATSTSRAPSSASSSLARAAGTQMRSPPEV